MNPKSREVVTVIGMFAVIGLIAFYIWSDHNRYYIIPGSGGAGAYQIDRKTGQSWVISGNQKFEHTGEEEGAAKPQAEVKEPEIKVEELPAEEREKLTGSAFEEYGYFKADLHNGSVWVVTCVVVELKYKDEEGKVLWSGELAWSETLWPKSTDSYTVKCLDRDEGKMSWSIKHAYGYKY
jgi:hypothetical protein